MDAQKLEFDMLLDEHIERLDLNNQDAFCMTQEKYEDAIAALQLDKGVKCAKGSHFKFWCLKNFKLQKIGSTNVLYCRKKSCPVITKDDIFDTIKRCHERVGHSGRAKTWDEIRANYSWIRHDLIPIYLSTCSSCTVRKPLKLPVAGKPIISLGFLTRVQIDLIDMTSRPDGDHKWILHMRDHFTKFSWTHSLASKHAAGVAERLIETFCLFGCPKIIQSDNGREFVAGVIDELTKEWPGLVIIHGRPRHPQSQGCIERGNGDLQIKLGKWLEDHPDKSWRQGLKFVTYAINTSTSATTNKSPYEVVFGQSPRTSCAILEILEDQGIHREEDVLDIFELAEDEEVRTDTQHSEEDQTDMSMDQPSTSESPLMEQGNEYQLLDGGRLVATGNEAIDRSVVHGNVVNHKYEAAFQITKVVDSDFVPVIANPFEEVLAIGQFVVWKIQETAPCEMPDTQHKVIREVATKNYLKAANKQQDNYAAKCERLRSYSEGDTVGVRIHNADRTNTSARLLPCKVLSIKNDGSTTRYKLYSVNGIIKTHFSSDELVNMSNVCFPNLQQVDSESLEEVTFISACRSGGNWNASPATGPSICSCKGSCVNNRCRCRKAGLKCSTKCHSTTLNVCQNKM